MKSISLGHNGSFKLPLDVVTMAVAVLAQRGAGKSHLASCMAEEMAESEQQVVAIDPTGAWYGLKSSADGNKPGYPFVVFGGDHADVPLEEHSGEIIARALVERGFSAIIDLSLFRKGQLRRFMADFLEALYRLNREPLHVFIDEADAIAPQRPGPDEARMLGAMEDLVRRGRRRGIGCTLITQRPQVLNKNVLTQCEVLVAMRLGHPRDISAIEEWAAVHADLLNLNAMVQSLPGLPTGTAWFWSPSLKIFEKVKVRARRTFDSGATPKPGQVVRSPKAAAAIDLLKLGKEIQETVEKAKADDPKELKAQIKRLEAELAKSPDPQPDIEARIQQAHWEGFREGTIAHQEKLREFSTGFLRQAGDFTKFLEESVFVHVAKPTRHFVSTPLQNVTATKQNARVAPTKTEQNAGSAHGEEVTGPVKRLLASLSFWTSIGEPAPSRSQVAFVSGYSPKSSGFEKALSIARTAGLLDYPNGGLVGLTGKGAGMADSMTAEEAARAIRSVLTNPQQIVAGVLKTSGGPLTREELAVRSDYSDKSSGYEKVLSQLNTLNIVTYPTRGQVEITEWAKDLL